MQKELDLQIQTLMAARDFGINSMLFRNAMARKFDLTLTESLCLTLLGINDISSPKELARHIGLTTGATTTLLDRLEKRGFIKRKSNPTDRRGVIIEIVGKYEKEAMKLVKGIQKANLGLVGSYTDKELEIITDFLNRFTENMVNETKKIEQRADK
jgi:DNA-binding MarR family transcriptional regulator